jgi:hypothetical protein
MNGATKEISVPKIPGEELLPYDWTLSPHGKILARALENDPSIRFLFLENGAGQKVRLPAWAGVTRIDWAADGKSLWAGAYIHTNPWAMLNYRSQRQSSPPAGRKYHGHRLGYSIARWPPLGYLESQRHLESL